MTAGRGPPSARRIEPGGLHGRAAELTQVHVHRARHRQVRDRQVALGCDRRRDAFETGHGAAPAGDDAALHVGHQPPPGQRIPEGAPGLQRARAGRVELGSPSGPEPEERVVAHDLAEGPAEHRPPGLPADLLRRRVVHVLVAGLEEEVGSWLGAAMLLEQVPVHDLVAVRRVHRQPRRARELLDRPVAGVHVGGEEPMSGSGLPDALGHGVDVLAGLPRVPVAGHDPEDVGGRAVARPR